MVVMWSEAAAQPQVRKNVVLHGDVLRTMQSIHSTVQGWAVSVSVLAVMTCLCCFCLLLYLAANHTCAAKAELKRLQAAAEQHAAVMAAELAAAKAAEASARAEATKARSAHASCSCQLADAQQELAQVYSMQETHTQ